MSRLNLTALEIFRAVALDGSVSGAATNLNRVQSNISTRIKQLEDQLGTVLFLRHKRGLTLTDDGRVLLKYTDRLLSLASEAVEAIHTSAPSGIFRLGTMESTAASRLPEILSHYHNAYPDVDIHLVTDTAGGLTRRLIANEIDVAFIAEPLTVEGFKSEPVFVEELILIGPASSSAIRKSDEINGKTIVAFEEGCAYRRYLTEWLVDADITPGHILSVGSYLAILACVSAGTGYAVVPKSVLDMIASKGQFRQHKLPGRFRKIRTLAVWRESYESTKLDALRAILKDRL
jgi:DNA-binding transcriptional LysR family regulator